MPTAVDVRAPLLVDSSVYIDLLRAGLDVGLLLRNRIDDGSVYTCGIIRVEVLRGIIDRRIREWMDRLFYEMIDCPIDDALVRSATDLAWRLDRRGTVLPVPDVLIASCGLRAGAAVATTDPHFKLVPDLQVVAGITPDA
jgi:predicted nucleic acid-binding protein